MRLRIVIRGAGAGLGRAFARRFAVDGDTVILLGRTGAKLNVVAAPGLRLASGCRALLPASQQARKTGRLKRPAVSSHSMNTTDTGMPKRMSFSLMSDGLLMNRGPSSNSTNIVIQGIGSMPA